MIDPKTLALLKGQFWFVALAFGLMFVRLLPMGGEAGALPGPDFLLCIVFAWVMRRPDFVPLWLLTLVVLLEDVLLMRPVGLWAALVVLAAEVIRARTVLMRELSFFMEWAVVATLMVVMLLAYRFMFALVLIPQVSFGFALVQLIWSIIAYPAVVLVSRYVLDLRKPSLGEISAFGRRL